MKSNASSTSKKVLLILALFSVSFITGNYLSSDSINPAVKGPTGFNPDFQSIILDQKEMKLRLAGEASGGISSIAEELFGIEVTEASDEISIDYRGDKFMKGSYHIRLDRRPDRSLVTISFPGKGAERMMFETILFRVIGIRIGYREYKSCFYEEFFLDGHEFALLVVLNRTRNCRAHIETSTVDESGITPRWRWRPDEYCPYEIDDVPEDSFDGSLYNKDLNGNGTSEALAVMNHSPESPCVIAALDIFSGEVLGQVWHFGHFFPAAFIETDVKVKRILLVGVANSASISIDHFFYPFFASIDSASLLEGQKHVLPYFKPDEGIAGPLRERYEALRPLLSGYGEWKDDVRIPDWERRRYAEQYRELSEEISIHELLSSRRPEVEGSGYEFYLLFPPIDIHTFTLGELSEHSVISGERHYEINHAGFRYLVSSEGAIKEILPCSDELSAALHPLDYHELAEDLAPIFYRTRKRTTGKPTLR